MPETNSTDKKKQVRTSYRRRRADKKKKQLFKSLKLTLLVLAVAAGLAFVTYRIVRPNSVNTAEAITSEDFDPLEEYDVVLEKGTLDQKIVLLNALDKKPLRNVELPVKTDVHNKISEVASVILKEKDLPADHHEFAAIKKLDSIWNLYLLNIKNDIHDPFMCDEYRTTIDEFIDSENTRLSKAAWMGKVRYLTGEMLTGRTDETTHVASATNESLNKFPNDVEVINNLRRLYAQIIAMDSKKAATVADAIAAARQRNGTAELDVLVRYTTDMALLYDAGIGDLPTITDLNTSIEDFYVRIEKLATNPNVGATVYKQLGNSISYLETHRHHDLAVKLGKKIATTSASQTDQELAVHAKIIGESCVTRNMLINSRWNFEETDFRGKTINDDSFRESVTLIVIYPQRRGQTPKFLKVMKTLESAFNGRNLRMVYVAVSPESDQGEIDFSVGDKNILLVTDPDSPNKFLQQCPTKRMPYFIIVNREGNVDSINVPIRALKTRIESIL